MCSLIIVRLMTDRGCSGCQFTPANSNQSLGQTKRSAREDESLFIDSAVPKKTSNSREMRVGDVPASEKRKSGGLSLQ